MARIDRREFMKLALGAGAMTVITLNAKNLAPSFLTASSLRLDQTLKLSMVEVLMEMVDLTPVYMRAFQEDGKDPHIPGPLIFASEGSTIHFEITNTLHEEHQFSIPGALGAQTIGPGETARFSLPLTRSGTFLYGDSSNDPINRVLGLHGVIAVLPASGNTPYSNPTPEVHALFNDLGTPPFFPGDPWKPERTIVWVLNEVDNILNERIMNGAKLTGQEFVRSFLPRYFTINGKSGFFAAHDHETAPHGLVGEPLLIRVANAGLAAHSLHTHANHSYQIAIDDVPQDNVILLDTWMMLPGQRKDVLFPYVKPPDIPAAAWPPRQEAFPLKYPMHCHMEMSQTAGGGNYPQGMVTDISFDGILPEAIIHPEAIGG